MRKQIDREDMEHLCVLGKLNLQEREYEAAAGELQKMLDYVEKLEELDTEGVEPLCQMQTGENVFRAETVTGADRREELLEGAPARKEGYFQVPRTVE